VWGALSMEKNLETLMWWCMVLICLKKVIKEHMIDFFAVFLIPIVPPANMASGIKWGG